ncbi:MAG: anaerobic ribonucleoside-triphosphate reductase [Blastocatellia bacterium]|jgi:ribonucleoside-triphosphate reductase
MNEPGEVPLQVPAAEAEMVVRQSHENLGQFDPQRIVDALVRETGLGLDVAVEIAGDVSEQIERLGIRILTAPLIRGLVDARLIEKGLLAEYKAHTRLGVPAYDASRIIQATRPLSQGHHPFLHGPEGTSLALAEAIKREYAMLSVFSEAVSYAHVDGDLYIEHLGEVDRPQSMIGAIDFIKRYGMRLPGGFAGSRPARRPEVLASHLVSYTAALQGYFSEGLAWDSLNFAFAPLLTRLPAREIRQLAQGLLFELSAPTIARGGHPIRCDLHLDWDAPAYIEHLPMIGAGGEKLAVPYGSGQEIARQFLRTLLDVFLEGDGEGRSFNGPRPILHLRRSFFGSVGSDQLLAQVEEILTRRGGLVIAFDRDEPASPLPAWQAEEGEMGSGTAAFSSRYGLHPEKLRRTGEDWQWRAAIFSSVALNLPRIGLRAERNRKRILELLTGQLELAAQASLEKRIFLEKLLARGESGALALLALRPEKEPFLPLSWTAHALCPVGLAEMIRYATGQEMAESVDGQELAWQVLHHLQTEAERLSNHHKVRFLLAESSDESTPARLASLDRERFAAAFSTMEASRAEGAPLAYTPAIKLPRTVEIAPLTRLRLEGMLQRNRIWGGTIELRLTSALRPPGAIQTLIDAAFHQTLAHRLTLLPEATSALSSADAVSRSEDES